jgi:pimeloyl-ACP methyl ester carboxylesterase
VTLIATPYQFVSDDAFSGGMDPLTFTQFRASYARDAARTKERFKALVAKGDSKFREVTRQLQHHPMVEDAARWLPWLDALGQYSQRATPPIASDIALQVIHGTEDAITPIAQAEAWQTHHPHIRVHRVVGAGHAPHLHDVQRLRSFVEDHHGVTIA